MGVYEYIDQSLARVTRSTRLNQPELQLSDDANDVIHGAALQQLKGSRLTVDKAAVIQVKPRSSSSTGPDEPAVAEPSTSTEGISAFFDWLSESL